MPIGFVLVTTASGKEHGVYNKLLEVPELVEVHLLFGKYDFIAKIETEDYDKMGQIVIDKIRKIEGVVDTKTLTGLKL